jgi:integrase
MEPVLAVAVGCGLRRGEIAALKWGAVDFKGATLRVEESLERRGGLRFKQPKTRSALRTIAVPQTVLSGLREHRKRQLERRLAIGAGYSDLDLVFPKDDGRPTDPQQLSKAFARLTRRCGINGGHLHMLRRTYTTALLTLNTHPKVASEMLGHASTAVTLSVYSHTTPALQEDAVRRLDEVFSKRLQ